MKLKWMLLVSIIMLVLVGTGAALAEEEIFFNGDTSGGDTFQRPFTNCSGISDSDVRYRTHEFTVSQSGEYRISLYGNFDTFLVVYHDSFDPNAPLTNCIGADDDSGGGSTSLLFTDLEAGETYIVVAAGYGSFNDGPYAVRIVGGENTADNNGGVAGNLLDGRLNNHAERDVAAPVAVYADDAGIKVYAINPADGVGVFALLVERAAVEAGQTNSVLLGQVTHPFTGAVISVYLLPSGEYQLNTNRFDGKPYRTVFTVPAVPPAA